MTLSFPSPRHLHRERSVPVLYNRFRLCREDNIELMEYIVTVDMSLDFRRISLPRRPHQGASAFWWEGIAGKGRLWR